MMNIKKFLLSILFIFTLILLLCQQQLLAEVSYDSEQDQYEAPPVEFSMLQKQTEGQIAASTAISTNQYYYDDAGRLDRTCLQYVNCRFLTYDKNGNILKTGNTRSVPLPNPGFETGLTNNIGYNVGKGSISVDTFNYMSGTKSLKINQSTDSESWLSQTHSFGTNIAGRAFTVSAYVKTSNLSGGVKLRIYWMDYSGNWIWSNIIDSAVLTGNNEWTKLTAGGVAPYGATAVTALISSNAGSGTYWLDDFENMEQISGSLSFSNPSFENGLTNDIIYNVGQGSINIDTSDYNTGTKSLKINQLADGESWIFQTHSFGTDIAGRAFTVSAYVKTSNLTGGLKLRIYWMDASGNWIWNNITDTIILSGNNEWTKLTTDGVAPYGATAVTALISSNAGSGTYWLDSFESLERVIGQMY